MSDEHRSRARRHILVVANPNPTDGDDVADRNPAVHTPTAPFGRYPLQQAATPKAHIHTPYPLDTSLRVNPSYSHTNLVPSLSSPSSTSSPAVESPPPPVTPGLPTSVVEPSLDARSRSQLDLPSTSSSSLRSESSTIQRLHDTFGVIPKKNKHTHRPKTSPTTTTKPTISMELRSAFTTYKPPTALPGRVVIQVTNDDDTYSNVEISYVTDGRVIREKIYTKLKIPDEDHSFNSIHRTHIGTTGVGEPLSDDMLYKICREEGDPHASLKFFVRRRFSPANYPNTDPVSPSVNVVMPPIFDPPTFNYSQPRVVPPLRPRKLRTNSRRGSVSSAASDRRHADGGGEYDASVSDGLEPDREAYRPPPRAPAPLPSPGVYQPGSPKGYPPRPSLPQSSSYFPGHGGSPPRDSSPDRPRRMPNSKSSLSQVSKQSPINDHTSRPYHREQPHHRSSSDNNVNIDDRNNKGQTTLDASTDYVPKAGRRTKGARSPQMIPRSESGEDPAGWVFVSSEGSSTLTARDSPVDTSRPIEIRKNTGLESQVSGSPIHHRSARPLVPPAPTVNAPRPTTKQVSPSILDPSIFAPATASKSTSTKTKSTPNLHDLFRSSSHHSSSSTSSQHPANLLPGSKGYYANNTPSTRPSLPTLTDSGHDATPAPEYTNKPSVVGSTHPHPLPRIPTEPSPINSRTTTEPISISGHPQLRHNSREHLYSPTGPISSSYQPSSSLSSHSNDISHGPRPRHHAGGGALSEDDARPHGHMFSPTDWHDGGSMAATSPQKPILDPYSSSSLSNITINAPKPLPPSSSSHISPPRSPTGPLPPPPPPPPTAQQHVNLLRPGTLTDSDTVISRNTNGTTVTRASDDSNTTIKQPAFPWFTQMMRDYEDELMREYAGESNGQGSLRLVGSGPQNVSATPPPPPPPPPPMPQQQEKTKEQQQQQQYEVGGAQGGGLGTLIPYGGLPQAPAPVAAKPQPSRPIRRLPDPQSTLLSSSLSSSSTNMNSNSSTLMGGNNTSVTGGTSGTSTIVFPPQPSDNAKNDDDDDDSDMWQVKPLDTPSISARQPPSLLVDTGLYPNRPAPPPPHLSQHDVLGNRSGLRRNPDHRKSKFETADERPPPEDVIEQLEDFFPGHDLDKPVIEATLSGTSPTNVEPPVPLPVAPSSSASNMSVSSSGSASATVVPSSQSSWSSASSSTLMDRDNKERLRGTRPKMSIRRVAKEGQKRIDRTSRYESSVSSTMSSSMFRKRSTKLWGSKLEEVETAVEHKPPTLAVPESPSGDPKPIFKWVRGELIGKGTYGRVYLALNATTGEMIAVKQVEIPRTSVDKADGKLVTVVEALKSESETLKDLDHPNIVQYLGFEETPRYLSIFLEYVPGGSVGSCLRKHGKFDENVTKSFTAQILAGLEYLHSRGVIHRDLKADNILVETTGICKISDFGISKRTDDNNQNGHTAMQGSVFWMAPEVIKPNAEGYTSKVDIWSVGCVVLEMWAGERPWSQDEMIPVMVKLYTSKAPPPIPSGVYLSSQAVDFRNLCFATDPNDRPTAAMLRRHEYLFLPDGWTFTCFSSAMHL